MKKNVTKKLAAAFLAALTIGTLGLTGCSAGAGNGNASDSTDTTEGTQDADTQSDVQAEDDKVIKVGASVTPHAEILEQVKDTLAEQGYTLEIVEYNDYVLPNTALEAGDLDANFFQHQP